ncbi:hypothetical protein M8J77_013266 [Diaphorina citri]|nr:hypothetical protein M8J77_013266 [Diaphorina citri]
MRFFIIFAATMACTLAQGVVYPSGYLADSPDVAAAKIAHFQEKAKAAAAVGEAPDYVTNYYLNYYKTYPQGNQYAPAAVSVLPSGYLADTPEVAAAKAAHFAEHAKASAEATPVIQAYNTEYNRAYSYASPYAYTPASITVLPNGYLADTPEVAAAKASHLAEVAKASAQATPVIQAYNTDYNRAFSYASPYAYTPASITVLPNGYLADTPEVAAAKVAHFAEHARASYVA